MKDNVGAINPGQNKNQNVGTLIMKDNVGAINPGQNHNQNVELLF